MKKPLLIQVFVILILYGCSSQQNRTPDIVLNDSACVKLIAEDTFDSLIVYTNYSSLFPFKDCTRNRVLIKEKKPYYLFFRATKPELVQIVLHDTFYVQIVPSDTVIIIIKKKQDSGGKTSVYYETDDPIIGYFNKEKSEFGFEKPILTTFPTSQKQLEEEVNLINSDRDKRLKFLEKNKETLPDWFIDCQQSDYKYKAASAKYLLYFFLNKMNLKGNYPPNDESLNDDNAKLSSYYYDFLTKYFCITQLDETNSNLVGPPRVLNMYNKAATELNKNLDREVLSYFNFGTILGCYNASFSRAEIDTVDNFRKLHDLGFSQDEEKYLDFERNERLKVIKESTPISFDSGDVAPIFSLKDTAGVERELSDFLGKVVYLHFWATWCQPCLKELPDVNYLCDKLKNEEVVIINICLDDELEKWMKIIRKEKLQGVNLICQGNYGNLMLKAYGIKGIPHYTLLDKNSRLIINECKRPREVYEDLVALTKNL